MEYINSFCLIQNIPHDHITSACTTQTGRGVLFLCSILGGRDQNGLSQEVVTGEVQEHVKGALGQEHVLYAVYISGEVTPRVHLRSLTFSL